MNVEKYYLDSVSPDGSGFIGYALRIRAWGTNATLSAVLEWGSDPTAVPVQKRTLRGTLPVRTGNTLAWDCPALSIAGRWQANAPPDPAVNLHPGVQWGLEAAPARTSGSLDRRRFAGLGYVERLCLRVAPWTLPIHTLVWGRFVSPERQAVWLEWLHPNGLRRIWCDGRPVQPLGSTGPVWKGGRVGLTEGRVLRAGRLDQTVLGGFPRLRALMPARLRAWEESKWLTRATLESEGHPPSQGWVIHERVVLA